VKPDDGTTQEFGSDPSLLRNLARALAVLRVRPFETTTLEGRSAERYRRIAWSTAFGIAGRLAGVAVTLVSIPLLLSYLGLERFGLWLTLTSIIAMLGPLDLGIGNGLTTLISMAYGRGDKNEIRTFVSTAAAMAVGVAVVLGGLFAIVYPVIPWAALTNAESSLAAAESGPAAAALAICFVIAIPLGLVSRIHQGFQEGYIASAWILVWNALALVLLVLAVKLGAGLAFLVLALAGGPLLAALLNGLVLFIEQRPWLRPALASVDGKRARTLIGTGTLFVVLQLSLVVGYQSDNIVIAQILGIQAVADYAVPMKLFMIAPTLLSFALAPLWPAYGEALARGDASWVARALRRSIVLAMAVNIPVAVLLLASGPAILTAWVGNVINPSLVLLVSLATWAILNSLNGPLSMLLVGSNAIRFAAGTSVLMAVANISLSIVLVARLGVVGAIIGSIIAQVVFVLIPWGIFAYRLLKDATGPTAAPTPLTAK
jgi:O-antigen/teichoic acid export membrane protein